MKPLYAPLNVAVLHIAGKLFPCGFDVAESAPDTLEGLRAHVAKTGRMLVYSGASDSTIFDDREVNWAFRAWHDHCHLRGNHPFTPAGEREACHEQVADIRALFGEGPIADRMVALVHAEVMGQVHYQQQHGEFPANQRAFVEAYLMAPRRAIATRF
jgi:hypothetical protein